MTDISRIKASIRAQQRKLRNAMAKDVHAVDSSWACQHAIQAWEKLRGRSGGGRLTLFSYIPYGSEISTLELIHHGWSKGDLVLAPKVLQEAHILELREIRSLSDLVPGAWGILEPAESCPLWPREQWGEVDWVVVPGLAFDQSGGRLGYGGGYYDRFADVVGQVRSEQKDKPCYVALAFPDQLIAHVPMESTDLRLDFIFTSDGSVSTDKIIKGR